MRCSILLTSLIGFFLLGAGCGSDQGNNTPDALPTDKQDAAAVNPSDAVADARQNVADVPPQDVAATDTQNAAEANPQDVAGVDAQAVTEAGMGEAGASPGAMASSSLARVTATLTDTEKSDLATSLSGFAFALWQGLRGDPSTKNNFAFSPTSISLALGMAYAGAQGSTASQMKSAMHVTSSSDVYFRSLNWLDQQLESRADAALKQAQTMYTSSGSSGAAPDPANFRLHVVNACWGDRTFTFEQPYLDTLATDFGSGVHLADFRTQPDTERLAINAWVSQETLNRINDLIPQGAIDTTTRTVLVNAIHLKLPWNNPFLEASTQPATVHQDGRLDRERPLHEQGRILGPTRRMTRPRRLPSRCPAPRSSSWSSCPRRPRRSPRSKTRWRRAMRQRSWRAWADLAPGHPRFAEVRVHDRVRAPRQRAHGAGNDGRLHPQRRLHRYLEGEAALHLRRRPQSHGGRGRAWRRGSGGDRRHAGGKRPSHGHQAGQRESAVLLRNLRPAHVDLVVLGSRHRSVVMKRSSWAAVPRRHRGSAWTTSRAGRA